MLGFCEICPHSGGEKDCLYPKRRLGATEKITVELKSLQQQRLLSTIANKEQIVHIQKGWAYSFRMSESGGRLVGGVYCEGDLLSTASFFTSGFDESARALSDMEVCVINAAEFLKVVRLRDDYFIYLRKMTSRLLWLLSNQCYDLSNRPPEERLCRAFIVSSLKLYGEIRTTNELFPVTQEVLADQIGVSKIHVNRMLVKLQKDGICHLRHGMMIVLDGERLRQKAGITETELDAWKQVLGVENQGSGLSI